MKEEVVVVGARAMAVGRGKWVDLGWLGVWLALRRFAR